MLGHRTRSQASTFSDGVRMDATNPRSQSGALNIVPSVLKNVSTLAPESAEDATYMIFSEANVGERCCFIPRATSAYTCDTIVHSG